jgi:anti-sigma factor RsiW
MKRCEEIKKVLLDYLLGEIPEDEAGEIKVHLQECPECRREYRSLKEVRELSTSATSLAPSREVYENLKAAVLTEGPRPRLLRRPFGLKVSFLRAAIILLIAAAILLVPVIYLRSRKAARPPLTTEKPAVSWHAPSELEQSPPEPEQVPRELAQIPADADKALEAYVAEELAARAPATFADFETPLNGSALEALVKERIAALVAANTFDAWRPIGAPRMARPIEVSPLGRPVVPPAEELKKEEKEDGSSSSSNPNYSHLDPEHRPGIRGLG